MLATFLQEAVEETAEQMPEEKTLSFIELILDGGIAGTTVRLFAVKAASKTDVNFMSQIKDNIANGNVEAAKIRCAQENSPVARLTAKGVSRIGSPLEDINTAIENAGRLEVYNLEKNVSILATIAGAGPMIGFLGTVIGMVLAFHELASSSGQAEMGSLAEGIYVAMTTTVAGLIVGIIAYIGYNHLVVKTDKVVHQMEATAVDFLDLLNEPA